VAGEVDPVAKESVASPCRTSGASRSWHTADVTNSSNASEPHIAAVTGSCDDV
jgi:hypothetical protein